MFGNSKEIEQLQLTVAQLIQVVNEQSVAIEQLQQQLPQSRMVFKGFGHTNE